MSERGIKIDSVLRGARRRTVEVAYVARAQFSRYAECSPNSKQSFTVLEMVWTNGMG